MINMYTDAGHHHDFCLNDFEGDIRKAVVWDDYEYINSVEFNYTIKKNRETQARPTSCDQNLTDASSFQTDFN